ncbi:Putative uncharacterized protein [Moritella viscosa]|uniref:Uncharacterized protein n=2 Tax=Moritella viscosa TaxID=80854 RepID=A0A090IJE4_9GAMM|nr:putative exported protein [Moritella viscosa]SGZ12030.1 Putative uncharacterized protein [Moritella viscosa]SHO12632.1 Putative uncharacterized protein [Moritella viscosa]SHO13856.1 Putative uncharacterized protein [Moritella viscosa]SHO16675.1 Putative uncharacterized protein [Moritella viscosa]
MDTIMKSTIQKKFFKTTPIALALIVSGYTAAPHAIEFNWGDVEGSFNSQITAGSSWRVEDSDAKNAGVGNGGLPGNTPTGDDGNLNYAKGDAFTQTIKGLHDLGLTYETEEGITFGAFVRGKYWYDYALDKNDVIHGSGTNNYVANQPINDDDFNNLTKSKGVALLDAYIFTGFYLGETAVDLRIGKQVVNWGESSFIQGGINAVNPVDAAAFRRPGAEVKEGLLPVNMIFANVGLTDNLSIEAFYQLEFEPTVIDSCGTYFSTADYLAEGCNTLVVDPNTGLTDKGLYDAGIYATRGTDEMASDDGQFGVAFKYYAESLNATEFGLYYMNYHSRLPYASAEAGQFNGAGALPNTPFIPGVDAYNPHYHTVYPEDIQLFGLSFNTTVLEWAVSGEVSHRLDMPLQINGADLLASALTADPRSPLTPEYSQAGAGDTVDGFDRFDYSQAQLTFIKFFDKALGTDRITAVAELGYGHVWDLDESDDALKYGRATVYGVSFDGVGDDKDGFTTSDSVGYRLAVKADYRNVFAGVDLAPSVAWSHDVYGYSPEPQGTFQEGRTGINVALKADYLKKYNASVSYTQFGGDFNPLSDRDYVSVAVGISF